jgi:hypothetical protein
MRAAGTVQTFRHELTNAISKFGKQHVASRIGVSHNTLAHTLDMGCQSHEYEKQNSNMLELARVEVAEVGLSEFARRLRIDASNLGKVMEQEEIEPAIGCEV